MLSTILTVSICDSVTLAIIVFGLAVAKCTTDSYHLDLVALTAFAPSLYVALVTLKVVAWPLAALFSILLSITFKGLVTQFIVLEAKKRFAGPTTITIISFGIFQFFMIMFGLLLSNKSSSLNLNKNPLVAFAKEMPIGTDRAIALLSGAIIVGGLYALGRFTKLIPLLKAYRENAELLIEFNYSISTIFWIGTLLSTVLAVSGGFLVLLHSSVGPSTAYNLFFLVFSVLLLVEDLSMAKTLVAAFGVTLMYNVVLAFADATHQPLVGSAILMAACGIRHYDQSRR